MRCCAECASKPHCIKPLTHSYRPQPTMNLNQLNISTRLFMLIGVLSVGLIGIGAIGLNGIAQADEAIKTVYEDRTIPMW